MSVTLRDIARRAHVSAATVSRALNDHPYVSEATREAVWQAVEELGYPLENLRRASESTRTVLLLIRDRSWRAAQDVRSVDVEGPMAYGAQSVLEEHGVVTRIQSTRMVPSGVEEYAEDPGIVGLILATGVVRHSFLCELQKASLPLVVAGSHVCPLCVNCVTADYARGMEEAVIRLIEGGRQRIGLVMGPPTTTSSAEKHRGYLAGLGLQGLSPDPLLVVQCDDFLSESGYAKTQELLLRASDLDAIAYASDPVAMGGLRALKEKGRRVPEDVAVVGFYDYELSRFTDPPLTTVRLDLNAMGRIAGRRLLMMLAEPDDEAWCVTVPTSLVVRGSA